VLFVLDHDRRSLAAVLSALSRRFANDFTVTARPRPERRFARWKRWQQQGSE